MLNDARDRQLKFEDVTCDSNLSRKRRYTILEMLLKFEIGL
jgi:hypothetical protein